MFLEIFCLLSPHWSLWNKKVDPALVWIIAAAIDMSAASFFRVYVNLLDQRAKQIWQTRFLLKHPVHRGLIVWSLLPCCVAIKMLLSRFFRYTPPALEFEWKWSTSRKPANQAMWITCKNFVIHYNNSCLKKFWTIFFYIDALFYFDCFFLFKTWCFPEVKQ